MRQRLSYKTYTRTTALQILESNLNKCLEQGYLNNWDKVKNVIRINKEFVKDVIPIGTKTYIPLTDFIIFLEIVPEELWCGSPVFYYDIDRFCWDALGFLGEKIHKSTVRTKYLQLCFAKLDISISEVLDNEEDLFLKYKNNKERFLAAIGYVAQRLTKADLKQILIKAKKLSDERFNISE